MLKQKFEAVTEKVKRLSSVQQKVLAICVVLAFAVLGILLISAGRAATAFISKQVENGNVSAPAQSVDDTTASGGKAVQFKNGTSPPNPPNPPVPPNPPTPPGPPPPAGDLTDVAYGTDPLQVMDIVKPAGSGIKPALIMVHGGGFADGDKRGMTDLATQLANNTPAVTFNVNYRLVPQGTYPNAKNDILQAINWIKTNAAFYNVDVNNIGIFGMSAGTTLVGSMMDQPGIKAFGAWSINADFPLSKTDPFRGADANNEHPAMKGYTGCTYEACPQIWEDVSPVYHLNAAVDIHIAHSQQEFIPLSQMYSMRDKHRAIGGYVETFEVAGDNHASKIANKPLLGDGRTGTQAILDFFKDHL